MKRSINLGVGFLIMITLIMTPAVKAQLHVYELKSLKEMKYLIGYRAEGTPLISSHRGGGEEKGYPENCLETFTHTLKKTWSMIECDPRYTKDSIMVLMHDETIDRTTTGKGRVSDYTLQELKQLFLKDNFGNITSYRIPTLDEALTWARGKTILILDKKKISATNRANAILKAKANLAAVVMCYNADDALECYKTSPNVLMQSIIPTKEILKQYELTKVPWENMFAFVSQTSPKEPDIIDALHKRKVRVIVGTSFTSDKEYLAGKLQKSDLQSRYYGLIQSGVDIIETNLGTLAGEAVYSKYNIHLTDKGLFKLN